MEWLWAHETQLDVLVSIFPWKTPHLATTATVTLKWQRAICDSLQLIQLVVISVNPDCRNIFFESKERPATGENKPCPILHPLCMELLEKKIDMPLLIYDTLDVCEESFLYFYNVPGENQYFPFEAPPKSGFWCLFFNFSFRCIVGLCFLQLAIKQFGRSLSFMIVVKWLSKPHRPMHNLCVEMNAVSCTHLIDMSNKTAKIITSTACYICTNIATNKCKRELLQCVGHTINTRLKGGLACRCIIEALITYNSV